MPDYTLYAIITLHCIRTVSFCTSQLLEELSQLSLLALWGILRPRMGFWGFISGIIEILYNQVSHDYLHCGKNCY